MVSLLLILLLDVGRGTVCAGTDPELGGLFNFFSGFDFVASCFAAESEEELSITA